MKYEELVKIASEEKHKAYAPYSGFKVGAAVVTGTGNVYTGVNIENASYGATNCAERTAVFKAVSNGERKIDLVAISSESDDYIFPCGICRQVLAEFGHKDTKIICSKNNGDFIVFKLEDLLPHAFYLK
ncbi:MAG TPA: cytidine deaminase [Clostridiaceae bacterium]|nr:cytidine deaminase [Clostridiaceae bacterium]